MVVGSHSFVEIFGGYYHTIARKSNGEVWAWGDNDYGQLGDNTIAAKSSPVLVVGSHNFFSLSETIIIEDIVVLSSIDISGTVCWGDDNPDEEYIRDFTGNITEGSGYRILGSGDLERVEFEAGGYIEIETWNLGVMRCSITTDKYESGSGSLTIKYKDGVDQSACEADSWNVYTGAFDCTGWIKVRVEAS